MRVLLAVLLSMFMLVVAVVLSGCGDHNPVQPAPSEGVLIWSSEQAEEMRWQAISGYPLPCHQTVWTGDSLRSEAVMVRGEGCNYDGYFMAPNEPIDLTPYRKILFTADLRYATEGAGRITFAAGLYRLYMGRLATWNEAWVVSAKNETGLTTQHYENVIAFAADTLGDSPERPDRLGSYFPIVYVSSDVPCDMHDSTCTGRAQLTSFHVRVWGIP